MNKITEMFKEFNEQCELVFRKKERLYKNSWKKCDVDLLIKNLEKQINNFKKENYYYKSTYVFKYTNDYYKRKMVHISNYCLMIYNRLDKMDKMFKKDKKKVKNFTIEKVKN